MDDHSHLDDVVGAWQQREAFPGSCRGSGHTYLYDSGFSRGGTRSSGKWAKEEMQRVGEWLKNLQHEMNVVRGTDVWSAVETTLLRLGTDLIVLGTHGRTGLRKMLMGSVAVRVLCSSTVPVMTVGPEVSLRLKGEGKFHRVPLATDFASGSAEAACFALSIGGTRLGSRLQEGEIGRAG